METDTDTERIPLNEFVRRTRIQCWIYEGVELELEYSKLGAEIMWLRDNEPQNKDIEWNRKRIYVIQEQLKTVNNRLQFLTGENL